MLVAQYLILQSQGVATGFHCLGVVALGIIVTGQVGERFGAVGVLGTKHALAYLKGFFAQRKGFLKVAGVKVVVGQIAQGRGVFAVVAAVYLLT